MTELLVLWAWMLIAGVAGWLCGFSRGIEHERRKFRAAVASEVVRASETK